MLCLFFKQFNQNDQDLPLKSGQGSQRFM